MSDKSKGKNKKDSSVGFERNVQATKTGWDRFKENSGPIGAILSILTLVISVGGAVGGYIVYLSKLDGRLEALHETINNPTDGLKTRVGKVSDSINGKDGLNEQVSVLRTKVDFLDRQNLKDLKAKGSKILKTQDVEIVRSPLLHEAKFSTPYESGKIKTTDGPIKQKLRLAYIIEGFTQDGRVIIRVLLEHLDSQGQPTKSMYDRRVQIKLPPVGEPVDYALKLEGDNFTTPPVHFKFVVLERLGPENVTLAMAVTTENSKATS